MKILAITLEKCSGCAVLIDDKIVFSTSEERYSRIKSDSSFPRNSINDALSFLGLRGTDFDKVIICGNRLSLLAPLMNEYSTFSVDDQIRAMEEYWYPNLVLGKNKSFLEVFKDKINLEQFPFNTEIGKRFDVSKLHNPYTEEDGKNVSNFFKQIIASFLGVEQEKIIHMEHDWCHAAYAFYTSPFKESAILYFKNPLWRMPKNSPGPRSFKSSSEMTNPSVVDSIIRRRFFELSVKFRRTRMQ